MHIVFFTHPSFQAHQSMPRYARWLADGTKERGHTVELWTASAYFYKWPIPPSFRKWMGYIDQFLIFPKQVKRRIKQYTTDTLFVFTDHALGPWVPLVTSRKHIIHCHDFLAQKSALGQIPQHPTGWSGKQYQAFIRRGYSKGKNFISISDQTQKDLHSLLPQPPCFSQVIYNGVNPVYKEVNKADALQRLQDRTGIDLQAGFILHVGGNQWYKNRAGVLLIYTEWRNYYKNSLPLLMIGEKPDDTLIIYKSNSDYNNDIYFLTGLTDIDILNAYNSATAFLFPSLAEGFGWPIAEAMGCGCPVITTGEAPMNEVGGNAAIYIPPMPVNKSYVSGWLAQAAGIVQKIITMHAVNKKAVQQQGLKNVERFSSNQQLNTIESVYTRL